MFMKLSNRDAFGHLLQFRSAKDAGLTWSILGLNPIVLFDGDTLTGSDNDPLAQWNDISGNDYHATQATESQKPLLKTGANGINGHNCIYGDGSDDYLAASIPGLGVYREMTWITVYQSDTTTTRMAFQFPGTIGRWGVTPGGVRLSNTLYSYTNDTSTHILIADIKENGSYHIWQDNVSKASGTITTFDSWNPTGINIMTVYSADGYWWLGKIAYIAIFPTQLSTENRDKIYNILAARYIP